MAKKKPRPVVPSRRSSRLRSWSCAGGGGRSIGQVAIDFDPTETAVREWVKQADLDDGHRSDGLTTAEREELNRLRRKKRRLTATAPIKTRPPAEPTTTSVVPLLVTSH